MAAGRAAGSSRRTAATTPETGRRRDRSAGRRRTSQGPRASSRDEMHVTSANTAVMNDDIRMVTLAERPDLVEAMWALESPWPPFMSNDPVVNHFYRLLADRFAPYQLLALTGEDQVAGKMHAVPFVWSGADSDLPDRGLDAILERAAAHDAAGRSPTAASLVEAAIGAAHRGTGLSARLLAAMAANCRSRGLRALFGPVRPTAKHLQPHLPMPDYLRLIRDDGLPADPWLRVHVRRGGRVVRVCPASMTIVGSLSDWRQWTGLAFDRDGDVVLPFALVPVHVSATHDHAVYVEPNVWVHHDLTATDPGAPASG